MREVAPRGSLSQPAAREVGGSRGGYLERKRKILGRDLRANEVQHFADTARRISAMVLSLRSGSRSWKVPLQGYRPIVPTLGDTGT